MLVKAGCSTVEEEVTLTVGSKSFNADIVGFNSKKEPMVIVEASNRKHHLTRSQMKLQALVTTHHCYGLLMTAKGTFWYDEDFLPVNYAEINCSKGRMLTAFEIEQSILGVFQNIEAEGSDDIIKVISTCFLIRLYLDERNALSMWGRMHENEMIWQLLHQVKQDDNELYQLLSEDDFRLLQYFTTGLIHAFNNVQIRGEEVASAFHALIKKYFSFYYIDDLISGLIKSMPIPLKGNGKFAGGGPNVSTVLLNFQKQFESIYIEKNGELHSLLQSVLLRLSSCIHFEMEESNKNQKADFLFIDIHPTQADEDFSRYAKLIKNASPQTMALLIPEKNANHPFLLDWMRKKGLFIHRFVYIPEYAFRPHRVSNYIFLLMVKEKTEHTLLFKLKSLKKDVTRVFIALENSQQGILDPAFFAPHPDFTQFKAITYNAIRSLETNIVQDAVTLDEIAEFNPEKMGHLEEKKMYNYIELNCLSSKGWIEQIRSCQTEQLPSRCQYIVEPGDILLSRTRPGETNDFRYIAMIQPEHNRCFVSNTMAVIRSKKVSPKFLYLLLRSSYVKLILHAQAGGKTVPSITLKKMKQITFPSTILNSNIQKEGERLYDELENLLKQPFQSFVNECFTQLLSEINGPVYKASDIFYTEIGKLTKQAYLQLAPENAVDAIPYVRQNDVDEFNQVNAEVWVKEKTGQLGVAQPNDIIVNKNKREAKCAVVKQNTVPNQTFYIVRNKQDNLMDSHFISFYLTYLISTTDADTVKLTMKQLSEMTFLIPSLGYQRSVVQQVQQEIARRKQLETMIDKFLDHLLK